MASRSENLKKLQNLNAAASLIANKQAISNNQTVKNGANIPSFDYIASATNKKGDTMGDRARQPVPNSNINQNQNNTNTQLPTPSTIVPTQLTVTPISELLKNYNWGNGSQYLAPDNPLTQDVVYNNEFSPEVTAQMSDAIYNKYYAPIVEQQQRINTQAYRNSAQTATAQAGAAGMATGSRGAIQAMNQANREAQDANLAYQQQQQIQAFKDTIDARNLELQNKIEDYSNAWEEIAKYGYVVSEKTGQLLGIQPGQQLTSIEYKSVMANIANMVAGIEADKVRLAQSQQQMEINKHTANTTDTSNLYSRLIDMLGRYDTVTPEMAALGQQLGMPMNVGDYTSNYMSEADIAASNYNQTSYRDIRTKQQIATTILPGLSGLVGITSPSAFATYLSEQIAGGATTAQIQKNIKDMDKNTLIANGISASNSAKTAAINAARIAVNKVTNAKRQNVTGYSPLWDIGNFIGNGLGNYYKLTHL